MKAEGTYEHVRFAEQQHRIDKHLYTSYSTRSVQCLCAADKSGRPAASSIDKHTILRDRIAVIQGACGLIKLLRL